MVDAARRPARAASRARRRLGTGLGGRAKLWPSGSSAARSALPRWHVLTAAAAQDWSRARDLVDALVLLGTRGSAGAGRRSGPAGHRRGRAVPARPHRRRQPAAGAGPLRSRQPACGASANCSTRLLNGKVERGHRGAGRAGGHAACGPAHRRRLRRTCPIWPRPRVTSSSPTSQLGGRADASSRSGCRHPDPDLRQAGHRARRGRPDAAQRLGRPGRRRGHRRQRSGPTGSTAQDASNSPLSRNTRPQIFSKTRHREQEQHGGADDLLRRDP